jgi:NAD(P)-dependent dehydrogenase (short-subunit alcohol dehydrogenase family)
METDLAGKIVLITGASSGIGRATAEAYARDGARVAITYYSNQPAALETARLVSAAGGAPMVVRLDLADEQSIYDAVGQVVAAWGGVDVLVNNAVAWSDAIPRPGRPVPLFEEVPAKQWQEVLRTLVEGVFHTVQAVLPSMRHRPWGRIVMLGAGLADTGKPGAGAYGAAKHALSGLARSLAWELGPEGILVNLVVPGQTLTEVVRQHVSADFVADKGKTLPSGRMSDPADVARAVVFMGSAANGNATGETLRVTGGA